MWAEIFEPCSLRRIGFSEYELPSYPVFLPSFFPYWVFFRHVFSGLRSDGILCKLSLSSVLVYLPHV